LSLRVFDLETENERLKRVSVNGLGSGLHSGLGSGLNAISGIAMGSSGVTSSMERLTNLYIPVQEQISELKNQLELKNRLILELSSMNK
jgi:hypothetical protein